MKNLLIFGAGGLGRETTFLVRRINAVSPTWNLMGFIDDTPELQGKTVCGIPVLGGKDYFDKHSESAFVVCAIGDPESKQKVVNALDVYQNIHWATLIDPQAVISEDIQVGCGTLIFPNTTVTVNVQIGIHVLVYYNTSVAHDVVIGDYTSINHGVNISGNVTIGTCSRMGVGSKVIEKTTIGDHVFVGAGGVVLSDIESGQTVVGIPARPIVRRD